MVLFNLKIPIIDPHLHFFAHSHGHYHWLQEGVAPFWSDKHQLQADFTESDISDLTSLDVIGFVHIEAGFDNDAPWREINWLESNCAINMRTIAFLNVTQSSASFSAGLQKLMDLKSFAGIRHIVDEDFVDSANTKQVVENLKILADHNLLFELQLPLMETQQLITVDLYLSEVPTLKVAINHAGFPPFNNQVDFLAWCGHLNHLANNPNCYIKVSGFEMVDRDFSKGNIKAVLLQCINSFGPKRVMLASNFPVLTLSCSYESYWQQCFDVVEELGLSISDLSLVNAQEFYGL
jgi:L-fuconolactonase